MEYSAYYETKLYPVQDAVLKTLKTLELPFYLTGGTALSRGYYNHRYSDDLDLFVNNDKHFLQNTENAINKLKKSEFYVETEAMSNSHVRIKINSGIDGLNKKGLKIDFVNDIPVHFGVLKKTPVYYQTDSIRNILSNKYTALYRISPKDIVDICEIAKHTQFCWKDIINEAEQKESGIDLKEVSEIFKMYDENTLSKIHWIKAPDYNLLNLQINQIAYDMITMSNNSLFNKQEKINMIENKLVNLNKEQKDTIIQTTEYSAKKMSSGNYPDNNNDNNNKKHK